MKKQGFILFLLLLFSIIGQAQDSLKLNFFEPAPNFNKARFWGLNGVAAAGYTGALVGLSSTWYSEFERGPFHTFNDLGEWQDVDKMGHFFTAYFESKWAYSAYRWTGMNNKQAAWSGAAIGMLFQTSVEVLDGFSEKWGFSFADIAFNTAGVGLFASQQLIWEEQRIVLKYSAHKIDYSGRPFQATNSMQFSSLEKRAEALYGTSIPELALKDYNGLSIWASVNIASFINKEESKFPKWLNVAVGYGAENMFSGFEDNSWETEAGDVFIVDPIRNPRYRQFYIAPDIDFTRIQTDKRGLKMLFSLINIVKMPAPALEINTQGKLIFHPMYF